MPVDFVKSGDGNDRSKPDGYDIEYTNPAQDQKVTKPKRGNLLSGLFQSKPKATVSAHKVPIVDPTIATSAAMPSTHVKATHTYQPVATTTTSQAPTKTTSPSAQPVGKAVTFTERHIPPPPPPPQHATQHLAEVKPVLTQPSVQPTVRSTVTPAPQPVAKPVVQPPVAPTPPAQPVSQPATLVPPPPRAPVPTMPSAPLPTAPSAPPVVSAGAPNSVRTRKTVSTGEVVAQNVTSIRGKTTNPAVTHPMMLGVNLLPNAFAEALQRVSPLFRLFRLAVATTALMSTIYLTMVGLQAFYVLKAESKLDEIALVDEEIVSYRSLQGSIIQTNTVLSTVNSLLQEHVYWTNGLAFLEQHTLSTVSYSGFTGSANGTMNLSAIAPDYQTVAQQLLIWESLDEVKTVSVTTVTRSESTDPEQAVQTSVQFNLSLVVDPSVLRYAAPNTSL